MDRIQVLDDSLINKIAAGEVVERPASVVKELVENAIDAGATKIVVDVQEGGRKRILVSDNGCGMSDADAQRSLLRHATSKIRTQEDLFRLSTMGFRGEALASISAVCKFTLMTCEQGSSSGVRLNVLGGDSLTSSPWQSAGGTTIICDDLFYNVPVRQKFLKSATAEYGAVLELVQAVALAQHKVDFTLIHNGKEVLRAPAVTSVDPEVALRQRFSQIMKGDVGQSMIYTTASSQWAQMQALLSPPGVERSAVKDMYVFVNGRLIKDKSLRFATLRGYHSHLLRGRYPVSVIFLTMDSGLVDANVHPAKTEVRLQYANEIHSMMATAIRDALRKGAWAAAPRSPAVHGSEEVGEFVAQPIKDSRVEGLDLSQSLRGQSTAVWREVTPNFNGSRTGARSTSHDAIVSRDFGFDVSPRYETKTESGAVDAINWEELEFLGSIADCYLLFKHGERATGARLLVVDQHAFHERVIYERLLKDQNLLKASQPMLVPECVKLGPKAVAALESVKPQLMDNGFSFEIIDDSHVELRAVPVLLAKADASELLETITEQLSLLPIDGNIGLLHDLLSTFACHGAVRAGERLGSDELKVLISEAKSVDFYHNCPHGRRVFRWWDEAQIARWFDR